MKKMVVFIMVVLSVIVPTTAYALQNPVDIIKEKVEEAFPAKIHEEFDSVDGKWSFTVDETDDGYTVKMKSKTNWEVKDSKGDIVDDATKVEIVWRQKKWNNRLRKEYEEFTFTLE